MRVMEISSFPQKIEIDDVGHLVSTRLSQTIVMWPDQAIQLLGYMCHPDDPESRCALVRMLWRWQEASEGSAPNPEKLGRIQHNWLRVADVLHLLFDLNSGQHQERRGGASIGKAITLVDANAKSRGTGISNLWRIWSCCKDVAPLVTAAAIVCTDARARYQGMPFGLSFDQLGPFQMAMLMPDLVLAVALEFERLGLSVVPHALEEPMLDSETLWRIPPDISVMPLAPPVRKIRPQDLAVLNGRRAGNRGKANAPKTTPVFG